MAENDGLLPPNIQALLNSISPSRALGSLGSMISGRGNPPRQLTTGEATNYADMGRRMAEANPPANMQNFLQPIGSIMGNAAGWNLMSKGFGSQVGSGEADIGNRGLPTPTLPLPTSGTTTGSVTPAPVTPTNPVSAIINGLQGAAPSGVTVTTTASNTGSMYNFGNWNDWPR